MCYKKIFYCLLVILFGASPLFSYAQVIKPVTDATIPPPKDSLVDVEILPGVRKLEFRKVNDSTQLQILAGNVKLKQGSSLFYCDSCVINNNTKTFEAWGNVHINDADTANIYSNHLRYLIDTKVAFLDGGVRLTDGKGTLTTPDLEYNMTSNIGIYKHGGKVLNKKTVLTSKEGYYYADLRDVYFKNNVELKDPSYFIKTDSLLYNTESQTARFIAQTFIRDSSGRTIETKDGFYNMQTGRAEFGQRPIIRDGKTIIIANRIAFDDSAGTSQAEGNAVVIDSVQGTTIIANKIFRNNKKDAILATGKPLMIIKQDNDSIYITADTLFSARLTDLYASKKSVGIPVNAKDTSSAADTVSGSNHKDSLQTKNIIHDSLSIQKNAGTRQTKDSVNKTITKADTLLQQKPKGMNGPKDSVLVNTKKGAKLVSLNEKDSTNRYFEAYRHVRIFSDSMQAVSDSVFYSFKDSVFRLYQNPVIWAKESQITGDTILVFTKNKKADRVKVFENSFMINKMDPEVYNQIKSTRMDGYFKDGSIDSVRAAGFAQCIYYIQDEDSAYTGINESKCDIMDIYFNDKALQKVVFRSSVTGTIWPIKQKDPAEMRLPNFQWLDDRRPKTKFELFE
jgi:lipopolysaccharide export system protein LptA